MTHFGDALCKKYISFITHGVQLDNKVSPPGAQNKGLVIGIVNSHEMARAKWTTTIVVFHKKEQSLMVLPFSCLLRSFEFNFL